MIDAFAFLAESRRPWLDAAALKQEFLPFSGASHPDRIHSALTLNCEALISTRLQPGVSIRNEVKTVLTVFHPAQETVEAVSILPRSCHPAKAGC